MLATEIVDYNHVKRLKREMERTPGLKVTLPNLADDKLVRKAIDEVK